MGDLFSLTGTPILVLSILVAVVSAAGIAFVAFVRIPRTVRAKAIRTVPIIALVLTAQIAAVSAVFFAVNDNYGLYNNWDDLNGDLMNIGIDPGAAPAPNGAKGLVRPGDGRLDDLTVMTTADGHKINVLFWLPPQYDDPAYADKKFPVVMFMPGQPGSGYTVFHDFDFAKTATQEISSGKVPPFIAVLPSLMIAPPRDTECTDVPSGPQAESWLTKVVPDYLATHYRAEAMGPAWSLMGWSTGGFCAAKLLLRHPADYSSAVTFGGYFTPLSDGTTGNLFGGSAMERDRNSPLWLYQHGGLGANRLMIVAGQQDKQAAAQESAMLAASQGDKQVAVVSFAAGGHNFHNYREYLAGALEWAAIGWTAPAAAGPPPSPPASPFASPSPDPSTSARRPTTSHVTPRP